MLVERNVKFWGAPRPVSKFRPRRGPCVKSPKKGRRSCQCRSAQCQSLERPAARVKVPAAPGPPCVKSPKKGRRSCQILGRPAARVKVPAAPPPPCVKSPKKRSLLVSMFLAQTLRVKTLTRGRPPLCQSVKIMAVAPPPVSNSPRKGRCLCQCLCGGAPCVKVSKKRSLLVSMFIDRRCVSKYRPAVGPLCVKLCKKRSSSVSNLGSPRGPCQNVSKFRAPRVKVSKCQISAGRLGPYSRYYPAPRSIDLTLPLARCGCLRARDGTT